MSDLKATWNLSLNFNCPSCNQVVDLLDYVDFWDGRHLLTPCENGTSASENIEVICPNCETEHTIDLEY